jgi:hypothetical protein
MRPVPQPERIIDKDDPWCLIVRTNLLFDRKAVNGVVWVEELGELPAVVYEDG